MKDLKDTPIPGGLEDELVFDVDVNYDEGKVTYSPDFSKLNKEIKIKPIEADFYKMWFTAVTVGASCASKIYGENFERHFGLSGLKDNIKKEI